MFVYDTATNPLNKIEWMFGFLECVHITSFAIAIGTIGLVDFRLIGLGLRNYSSERLLRDTSLWTLTGLIFAVTSGLLLFSTDPERYAVNPSFRFKMVCLVAAIVFNYSLHGYAARSESRIGLQRIAGIASLLLWIPVIFGGLFYAFT